MSFDTSALPAPAADRGPRRRPSRAGPHVRGRLRWAGPAALALLGPALSLAGQDSPGVAARIERVEGGLLAAVHVRGRAVEGMPLPERMRRYRVPAVSVAVMEGGRLVWSRAWGLADAARGRPATTETVFQAASISKPIAALRALRAAERGELSLDEDIAPLLAPWRIERGPGIDGVVTLRRLLSHTAGLTVHGFRGYARDHPVPTTLQVLEGSGPANSPRVEVDLEPGTEWRYSGGGYTVAQYAVERLSGRPFHEAMREVLDALGMRSSTYEQPLPDSLRSRAASGYREDGSGVEGAWHTYPEEAAAGLWTTPEDLARYALAVGRWWLGEEGGVLSPDMTREMLEPGLGGWGLGPATRGEGLDFRLEHGGANEGFRSHVVYYPARGLGAVIMTNGDGGDPLIRELLLSIAAEYGWPEPRPREIQARPIAAGEGRAFAGRYRMDDAPDVVMTIRWRDGHLEARVGDGPAAELIPVARDRFVRDSDGGVIRFERDAAGRIETAFAYGSRARRLPPR